jgi:hypothetical protein
MPDKGLHWRFDDPIPLPRGRRLFTLQDAGNYITKLPKAEHDAKEWQAAAEALLLVVEHGGPTMFAHIGVMQTLNRKVERVFNPDRKAALPKQPANPGLTCGPPGVNSRGFI